MKKVMTTLAVFALGASLAVAAPQQDKSGQWGHGGGHHRKGNFEEKLAGKLNLSEGQKLQLKDLKARSREQNQAFFASVKQTRQEFRAAKQANDQARIDALKPTMDAQRAQMKQLRQAQHQQFLSILTPDQRAQLDALKAEHKAKRGQRRGQQQ